jgi:tRNA nucleotidyltransferase/poly(A) polymerase
MALDSRELRFMGGTVAEFVSYRFSSAAVVASGAAHNMLEAAVFSVAGGDPNYGNRIPRRNLSSKIPASLPQQPRQGYGPSIRLTPEERDLFTLLRQVRTETGLATTLRVAGGWVRDKLLSTPEFQTYHRVWDVGSPRLTSKFQKPAAPSMGRQGTKVLVSTEKDAQPVDIDIALDDMLGREFADHLNDYLSSEGEETISVGVVLKNPEKSKHLETATMKVGAFWIDFVNLRAEEYTQDSRIPDLMRIGTAAEDAFRRDLTINSLFYNVNTGQVEDWTGRGFDDLRKGIVATPLPPLTTLLDDPLRALRSVRFAARLRFTMDDELVAAAKDDSVRNALAQKVSRERVGGELDLMLRSPDPVGAMRLLINLRLVDTVFPIQQYVATGAGTALFFDKGVELLAVAHDHLADCRWSPPLWCKNSRASYGAVESRLMNDEESRRLLWYAAFLKPLHDHSQTIPHHIAGSKKCKKHNRSVVCKLLVDELKRPTRDAGAVERILQAANDFTQLVNAGCDISATMILLSDIRVTYVPVSDDTASKDAPKGTMLCTMAGRLVNSATEEDPLWQHAMEFRLLCAKTLQRIGPLWRAALFLSIAEAMSSLRDGFTRLDYAIEGDVFEEVLEEGRQGTMERYDAFATALQQTGLIGIWDEPPLLDGDRLIKNVLPGIPKGPTFRDVMDEQSNWIIAHPGANEEALVSRLCYKERVKQLICGIIDNTAVVLSVRVRRVVYRSGTTDYWTAPLVHIR